MSRVCEWFGLAGDGLAAEAGFAAGAGFAAAQVVRAAAATPAVVPERLAAVSNFPARSDLKPVSAQAWVSTLVLAVMSCSVVLYFCCSVPSLISKPRTANLAEADSGPQRSHFQD